MKQKSILCLLSCATLVVCTLSSYAQTLNSGQPDYDSIAHKIVNYNLEVKPGEVVIITGTPAELDIMEALAVATSKAGGQATMEVSIPEANRRVLSETPIEYLKLMPTYTLMQMRAADCFITTTSIQDPKLFADVPEERMAAARLAILPLNESLNRAHFRSISLGQTGGIPTKAYAEAKGANYEDMVAMFWKSLDVDYDQMMVRGTALSGLLKPGSVIELTSESGTNLTFKIGDIPSRINCGRCAENISASGPSSVWLPAGEVYACADPSSASGTMVVPDMDFRGNEIKNLKLTFENGKITHVTADKNGDLFSESLEMSTGDKNVLSAIDIGLNPNSQTLKDSDYYSWEMAGMVTLVIGNNSWAGGDVVSDNSFGLHLAHTTLKIDGKNIISEGHLEASSSLAGK